MTTRPTSLPRIPIAARLNAVVAACLVTLATLAAIDHLAAAQGAASPLAQTAAAQRA